MRVLRNFENSNKYYDLDMNREFELDNSEKIENRPKICGWFMRLDGSFNALFVENLELRLLHNKELFQISDDSHIFVNHNRSTEKYDVKLYKGDNCLIQFEAPEVEEIPNLPPFDMIEREHYDWAIFLNNVINDRTRRLNIILNFSR